ncbi:NAD-dependent epimerase/dehydratase family protein [Nocardia sp. NBC_00508]|uniref:NAD-dependent epimerase/dehydratase family protein n=1 Tax=Nocardia sp. NBC_00508 TaxID=2975992 RepID=UPI003FA592D3
MLSTRSGQRHRSQRLGDVIAPMRIGADPEFAAVGFQDTSLNPHRHSTRPRRSSLTKCVVHRICRDLSHSTPIAGSQLCTPIPCGHRQRRDRGERKDMMQPVLVTGGTGRLGRAVVDRLISTDREVRVLSRRAPRPGIPSPSTRPQPKPTCCSLCSASVR